MPEGPEAQYIADMISESYKGKTLNNVEFKSGRYVKHGPPKGFKEFKDALPMKLKSTYKKGKVIFIEFSGEQGTWIIISKLGLSGWWYPENQVPEWGAMRPNMVMTFTGQSKVSLIFSDKLSYGTLQFTKDPTVVKKELDYLAPDIMDKSTKIDLILPKIMSLSKKKSEMAIEDLLMDQHLIVSSVGNYLKAEILYACKIRPDRATRTLTPDDWSNILKEGHKIMKKMSKALEKNDDHSYMFAMNVYRKEYDPHGNPVVTRKAKNGRTTFWVPAIQK